MHVCVCVCVCVCACVCVCVCVQVTITGPVNGKVLFTGSADKTIKKWELKLDGSPKHVCVCVCVCARARACVRVSSASAWNVLICLTRHLLPIA